MKGRREGARSGAVERNNDGITLGGVSWIGAATERVFAAEGGMGTAEAITKAVLFLACPGLPLHDGADACLGWGMRCYEGRVFFF